MVSLPKRRALSEEAFNFIHTSCSFHPQLHFISTVPVVPAADTAAPGAPSPDVFLSTMQSPVRSVQVISSHLHSLKDATAHVPVAYYIP